MTEPEKLNSPVYPETPAERPVTQSSGAIAMTLTESGNARDTGSLGQIIRNDTNVALGVILSHTIAEGMPRPHANLDSWVDLETEDYYYITGDVTDEYRTLLRARREAQVANFATKRRVSTMPGDVAPTVDAQTAAELIRAQKPENILFLTGAGISAKHIWTHEMAANAAGFSMSGSACDISERNMRFAKSFIVNPDVAAHAVEAFNKPLKQMQEASPTPAHFAFSALMAKLGDLPMKATTNHDLLHLEAGSLVPAIGKSWPETRTSDFGQDRAIAQELERRARSIGLIVAIGANGDNKNVMAYVRQQQPEVKILALSTNSASDLHYLRSQDALLQGDCQKELPAVLQYI